VIDASTGETLTVIAVGGDPSDIAYGDGALWVPDGRSGAITKIDAATRQSTTIRVGVPLRALTVDERSGSLWAVTGNQPPAD